MTRYKYLLCIIAALTCVHALQTARMASMLKEEFSKLFFQALQEENIPHAIDELVLVHRPSLTGTFRTHTFQIIVPKSHVVPLAGHIFDNVRWAQKLGDESNESPSDSGAPLLSSAPAYSTARYACNYNASSNESRVKIFSTPPHGIFGNFSSNWQPPGDLTDDLRRAPCFVEILPYSHAPPSNGSHTLVHPLHHHDSMEALEISWLENCMVQASLRGIILYTQDLRIEELYSSHFSHFSTTYQDQTQQIDLYSQSILAQRNFDALLDRHVLDTVTVLQLRGEWHSLPTLMWNPDQHCIVAGAFRLNEGLDKNHQFGHYTGSNFGDDAGPVLVGKLSGKDVCLWSVTRHDQGDLSVLLSVGSVLGTASKHTVVWGSGAISAEGHFPRDSLVSQDTSGLISATPLWDSGSPLVLATRGPLSRLVTMKEVTQIPLSIGDPVLLFGALFPRHSLTSEPPKHRVCLVLHYIDDKFDKMFPTDMHRLNIKAPVIDFITSMVACRRVVSSTLHGVITAHAYGIPCLPIRLAEAVFGHSFKFDDHFRSGGHYLPIPVLDLEKKTIPSLLELIEATEENFPQVLPEPLQTRQLYSFPLSDASVFPVNFQNEPPGQHHRVSSLAEMN